MNPQTISQAIRYVESRKETIEALMVAGDVADGTHRKEWGKGLEAKYDAAKKLLNTSLTMGEIAQTVGMNRTTLINRLKKEGIKR